MRSAFALALLFAAAAISAQEREPINADRPGIADGSQSVGRGVFQAELGVVDLNEKWSLNPNVGVVTRDDGDGRFTAALAALTLQYNITKKFNVFVDGALQSPEGRGGSAAVIVDTGAVWIVGNDTQLDVEAGWGARG